MDTLALTDRDGVYGAVRFAQAARRRASRPVLGVDLAVEPSGLLRRPRWSHPSAAGPAPAAPRTGPRRRDRRPAAPAGHRAGPRQGRAGRRCAGWFGHPPARRARAAGEHPRPGRRARPGRGRRRRRPAGAARPGSEVGRALHRPPPRPGPRRCWPGGATWSTAPTCCSRSSRHRGPGRPAARPPGCSGWPSRSGCTAVLTNAVRYADRREAPTVDVLDAARRLVALDSRHLDRVNAEGYLKSGKEMARGRRARSPPAAGLDQRAARRLLAATRRVADRCAVDPRADLGIGEVHFPELDVLGATAPATSDPVRCCAQRCCGSAARPGYGRRGEPRPPQVRRRLDDELEVIETLGYPSYFLTVADVVDLIRDMGVRVAARGSGAGQPGQLPARHLRGRPDPARPADGAVPARRCARRCPTSTSTSSRPGAPRSTSGSSTASAASGSPACR